MPNEQVVAHIRSEVARGVDIATITKSLLAVGWKVEDINAAIAVVQPASNIPAPSYSAPAAPEQPAPVQKISGVKTLAQNTAAGVFIACICILTIVAIMGVWRIFSGEVIMKSFETLGLLAFVAMVVIVASKFVGDPNTVAMPSPGFRAIRNSTLATLIVSASLLALFGVLSIWDVITDKDVLTKSLSSLAIIAFSSLIIVMVALEREQNPFWKKRAGQISGGTIILGIFFVWFLFSFLFRSF